MPRWSVRRGFGYPPITRLAVVRFEAGNENHSRKSAAEAAAAVSPVPDRVRLRGPAPAPLERIRNHWRWQILLTAPNRELLRECLEKVEARLLNNQTSARACVEKLGFTEEGILPGFAMDLSGKIHDLVILSTNVGGF